MKDRKFVFLAMLLLLCSCGRKVQDNPIAEVPVPMQEPQQTCAHTVQDSSATEVQVPQHTHDKKHLIAQFYKQNVPNGDFGCFSRVVIINERGTCMNCNSLFAKRQLADLDNDSVLFIISSQGARIDISGYLDSSRNNVIWDTMYLFNRFNIVDSCTVIQLKTD